MKGLVQASFLGLLLCVWSLSLSAQTADDLLTVNVEGSAEAETVAEGVREATNNGIKEAARIQILEMIGDKKYQKNQVLIDNKIIQQSSKFIPIVNPGPARQQGQFVRVPLEMKVSLTSLRQILLSAGLMYDAEGPATLMPMITFVDRVHSVNYRWWMGGASEEKRFLVQLNRSFNESLYSEFAKQGFYLIRQQSSSAVELIPPSFRNEKPHTDDYKFLAEHFKASLIVRGSVRFSASKDVSDGFHCAIKLTVFHAGNAREIAEVARTYETDAGTFEAVVRNRLNSVFPDISKDLAVQVLEAWQKGTLGANVVTLAVRGSSLTPQVLSEFKSALSKSVREIKSLKERRFEPYQVTYEIDFDGEPRQFAERFRHLNLPGFRVKLGEVSNAGLAIELAKAPQNQ